MTAPLYAIQLATDPFESLAAGAELGTSANWTKTTAGQWVERSTLTSVLALQDGVRAVYQYDATLPSTANCAAKIECGTVVSGGSESFGPAVLISADGATYKCYAGRLTISDGKFHLHRIRDLAGVATVTLLASSAAGNSYVAGDTLRLETRVNGSGNVELSLFKNDADPAVLTYTDTDAAKITAIGAAGFNSFQVGASRPDIRTWWLFQAAVGGWYWDMAKRRNR